VIKVGEFMLLMSALSLCLIYGPSFVREWVHRGPESEAAAAATGPVVPSGRRLCCAIV
jgi:hypothetical protein